MIRFLQKLVVLWEKSKFLTLMEMETDYLRWENRKIIERDTDHLRKKVAELKAKEKQTAEDNRKIIDVEGEINETEKYRQMLESSRTKSADLKKQIAMYRKELWR